MIRPCSRFAIAVGLCGVLALAVAAALPPGAARACATVFREDAPVRVKGEEALIVWEPEDRVQHFIRKAGFEGATEDFGFLVPTPARPELGEADPAVFSRLFQIYRRPPPRSRSRGRRQERSAGGSELDDPFVAVIERRVVAGLDAAVLTANDAGALEGWLREHGYPSGDALRAWLAPYVERGWFVTAFRYAPAAGGAPFSSNNVRMTFETDVPFFPYSEPRGRPAPARPFRVSVVAPYRVDAREGPRRARIGVGFASELPAGVFDRILRGTGVPGLAIPREGAWLTVFDERRSRRGAHDLTFVRARAQRPVRSRIARQIVTSGAEAPAPEPRPRRRARPGEADVMDPFAR